MDRKPVRCIVSQRRILARCIAVYAYAHDPHNDSPREWRDLNHYDAEDLIKEAEKEMDSWVAGGSIFEYVKTFEKEE